MGLFFMEPTDWGAMTNDELVDMVRKRREKMNLARSKKESTDERLKMLSRADAICRFMQKVTDPNAVKRLDLLSGKHKDD